MPHACLLRVLSLQLLLFVSDFNVFVQNTVVHVGNCKFCSGLVTIVTGLFQFQLYFTDVFLKMLILSILLYSKYSLYIDIF